MDRNGELIRHCSLRHHQAFPQPGYAEHDAEEIWQNVLKGIQTVTEGLDGNQLAAIALSNQRETTVFWDRATGVPVRPAIVWQDVRGAGLCQELKPHEFDDTKDPMYYYEKADFTEYNKVFPSLEKNYRDFLVKNGLLDRQPMIERPMPNKVISMPSKL